MVSFINLLLSSSQTHFEKHCRGRFEQQPVHGNGARGSMASQLLPWRGCRQHAPWAPSTTHAAIVAQPRDCCPRSVPRKEDRKNLRRRPCRSGRGTARLSLVSPGVWNWLFPDRSETNEKALDWAPWRALLQHWRPCLGQARQGDPSPRDAWRTERRAEESGCAVRDTPRFRLGRAPLPRGSVPNLDCHRQQLLPAAARG